MRIDIHEQIRLLIDKSMDGTIERHEELKMSAHLSSCLECRDYRDTCDREIASMVAMLNEIAFDASPGLDAQVHSAMEQQLQTIEADRKERQRELLTSAAAFLVSFLGSFLLWEPSYPIASYFHITADELQLCLFLFWVVPSLLVALLIPVVPGLLAKTQASKGFAS